MVNIIRAAFLSASVLTFPAAAQTADEAPQDKSDRFVCITQDSEGKPAALYKSPDSLYKPDGALTFAALTQIFGGGSVEGGNFYTRDKEGLQDSVRTYQERLDEGRLILSPADHKAQLEEWKKGADAIRTQSPSCQDLAM